MFCGRCGKEAPEGYKFCMSCGAELETSTEQVIENKKRKWTIPVLVLVVVVVIVISVISVINVNQKKNGLYNNVAWGTSFDQIKKMVEKHSEDEVKVNEDKKVVFDLVENYQDFEGVNAIVFYQCNDAKKLKSVYLTVNNKEGSKYTDKKLYDSFTEKFTELYGEYEDKSYKKIWTTKKSTITLMYVMEGLLTVNYEAITDN